MRGVAPNSLRSEGGGVVGGDFRRGGVKRGAQTERGDGTRVVD